MKNEISRSFEKIKAEEELKEKTREAVLKRLNERPRQKRGIYGFSAALAAAAFLLFFGIGSYQIYFSESSYIDLDVNPSIELSVNRFERVIKASAYNQDGKEVLSGLNLKHRSYKDAVSILLKKIKNKGYLKNKGIISVTVQGKRAVKSAEIKALNTEINQCISGHEKEHKIEVYAVSKAVKRKSHHWNVSPAKYLAIKELQRVDQTATVETCRDHSISEIKDYTKKCEEEHGENQENRQQGHGQEHHSHGSHHGH